MRGMSPPKLLPSVLFNPIVLLRQCIIISFFWSIPDTHNIEGYSDLLCISTFLLFYSFKLLCLFLVCLHTSHTLHTLYTFKIFSDLVLSLLLFSGFTNVVLCTVLLLNCHFEQFIGSPLCRGQETLSFPDSASGSNNLLGSNWVYASTSQLLTLGRRKSRCTGT